MDISFREAQLMVLGAERLRRYDKVYLNNLQTFSIGDTAEVIEISLTSPIIVVRIGELETYCNIENFSDKVIEECINILREVAEYTDNEYNKK